MWIITFDEMRHAADGLVLGLFIVYVDDFKLACRLGDTASIWKELQARIKMDQPAPVDRFLGCYVREFSASANAVHDILANSPQLWPR